MQKRLTFRLFKRILRNNNKKKKSITSGTHVWSDLIQYFDRWLSIDRLNFYLVYRDQHSIYSKINSHLIKLCKTFENVR